MRAYPNTHDSNMCTKIGERIPTILNKNQTLLCNNTEVVFVEILIRRQKRDEQVVPLLVRDMPINDSCSDTQSIKISKVRGSLPVCPSP